MARLTFLGSGGTSAVVSRQTRASGGIILQLANSQFHIDPGPGALVHAKNHAINVRHTTAVLVSHNHLGHCGDLNAVVDAMTHGGLEKRGILLASKSTIAPEKGHPVLSAHHAAHLERIIPLEQNHKVGLGSIEIHALPAVHTDPTAIGFKFVLPGGVISYSGDTALSDELVESLMGTDVLILNTPYSEKPRGMNLSINNAIEIVQKVQPKIVILTHFGLDVIKEDTLVAARRVQRETNVQTIAAKDGLVLATDAAHKNPVKGY